MNASAHLAAGAVAGLASLHAVRSRPARIAIAIGLGLLSHVLLDAIPHSDYVFMRRSYFLPVSFVEGLAMVAVVAAIVRGRLLPGWRAPLVIAPIAACAPDMKVLLSRVLPRAYAAPIERHGDRLHDYFHAAPPDNPFNGLAIEVACALLLLFLLSRFPRVSR